MKISLMCMDDYPEASRIWQATEGMGLRSLDDSYEGINRFLVRNPRSNFICRTNDETAGVILAGHDGRRGYIYHAAVKEKFRNRGIGRNLVLSVIEAMRAEGIHKIGLVVFSDNTGGNSFWESLGFENRRDLVYRNLSINSQNY